MKNLAVATPLTIQHTRRIRRATAMILALVLLPSTTTLGQAPTTTKVPLQSSKPLTWQEACKRLESDDTEECLQCESILREALGTDARTEEMACALALFCFKRQDYEDTKKTLSAVRSVFLKPSSETINFAARLQFDLLLVEDREAAKTQATAIFRDLVLRTWKDTTIVSSDMRANAALIGTACGMLRSKQADSPLSEKDLAIAEKCMLECPSKEVVSSFKYAFEQAQDRVLKVEQTIDRISKMDPAKVAEEQKVREERLAELDVDYESNQSAARDALSDARDEDKENTNERRQISQTLRNLDKQWKTPTPGHPGPRPSKPNEPKKSDVDVDKYHMVNNQRVRKSDAQIRSEEADEWRHLQTRYQNQLSNYGTLAKQWDTQFNAWQVRDNARRTALKKEQMAAQNRQQQVLANLKQVKQAKSDAAEDLRNQRTEFEELSEEYELIQIALKTIEAQSPAIAFRPPHFELLHFTSECRSLLNRISSLK